MRTFRALAAFAAVAAILPIAAYLTRDRWQPLFTAPSEEKEPEPSSRGEATSVKISPQARENLGLTTKPVRLQTFLRTIQVPGLIVDRPGRTDRGVPAPAEA